MGVETWIDPKKVDKIRADEGWKDATALPPTQMRPQHHLAEKLLKNNKNINTCSNCMYAYRKNKTGEVLCGNFESGYQGFTIEKPRDFGCRKWKLRRKEQPPIFKDPAKNKQLARYVDYVERGPMDIDTRVTGRAADDVVGFRRVRK